jgi:hypothetical protein
MEITYLAVERSLKFDFTTFAYVARHDGMTRWRTVSTGMQKDVIAPGHFFNTSRRACPRLRPLSFRSPTTDAFFPSRRRLLLPSHGPNAFLKLCRRGQSHPVRVVRLEAGKRRELRARPLFGISGG